MECKGPVFAIQGQANPRPKHKCVGSLGVEPRAYLRHILKELPYASTVDKLEALQPWNVMGQVSSFKGKQNNDKRQVRR